MWKTLFAAACGAALLVILEIARELSRFKVTHYQVSSSKLSGKMPEKKVVFLSDLHNHKYGKSNEKLFDAVRRQNPDLILVTGDMLIGKAGRSWETASQFMKRLPGICPVYHCNGNHEQRMREHPEKYGDAYFAYKKELEEAGVRFLVNEKDEIYWEGNAVTVTGLEIPGDCYQRGKRGRMSLAEMKNRIGRADRDAWQVLMVHQPDFMTVYEEWGADLILSGHMHGGIVRIPGLGGVISPQAGLFPKYSGGIYREGDTSIVVSKGLGTHTVNIRLFNPAELIVLHVKGS